MNARKKQFLYKLIPPRSTFAQDMTEVERKVMQEHATYWKGVTDKGIARCGSAKMIDNSG